MYLGCSYWFKISDQELSRVLPLRGSHSTGMILMYVIPLLYVVFIVISTQKTKKK